MAHLNMRKFGRRYRRYRHDNQYDSPLLIFSLDLLISVTKLLIVALIFWGLWWLATKLLVAV